MKQEITGKKEVTASELLKTIKAMEQRRVKLLRQESGTSTFLCASTEDPESIRPEYDFDATQEELRELEDKIMEYKHLINVFNTTTLVGDTGLTIDEMLVKMPQLSARVEKLGDMSACQKRQRVEDWHSTSNIIDYKVANYDIKKAETEHEKAASLLREYQLALDSVNMTAKIKIE